MTEKYILRADGKDVYRNFVIPNPLSQKRNVRGVELNPGNRQIVHHAFIKVDGNGNARKLDGRDGQTGFPGMIVPEGVRMPKGYFLSWQPGKSASSEPPGYGWVLEPGQDFVLQTHLKPSGKEEVLEAEIGIYFTDVPPTNLTALISLTSLNIAIPAGESNYIVEDEFTLPVSLEVLAVLPHTHYLGKNLEGWALLPNGTRQQLLSIPDWDFNWQGDYRYAKPVNLPAGTRLQMRYVFDNSSVNRPPKEVRYGSQT
jgi:hypothetical protein